MYIDHYLLPYDVKEVNRLRERWNDVKGHKEKDYIFNLIKKGAGEHLLESDFQSGKLSVIENEYDLRGLEIHRLEVKFPDVDNFKGIDFSYSSFSNCTFTRGTFLSVSMNHCQFSHTSFIECTFILLNSFAALFHNCTFKNCKFIDANAFTNCLFDTISISETLIQKRIFYNCKFNKRVEFNNTPLLNFSLIPENLKFDHKNIADTFSGIKESYKAGEDRDKTIEFYLLQKKYYRINNIQKLQPKILQFFLEFFLGYGFRPLRVFMWLTVIFIAFTLAHFLENGMSMQTLILSAGSFFTFGAMSDMLEKSHLFFQLLYIFESFCGVGFVALFITTLANYFFGDIP